MNIERIKQLEAEIQQETAYAESVYDASELFGGREYSQLIDIIDEMKEELAELEAAR